MLLALLLPLVVCTGYLACAQPICRDLQAPFEYSEAAYCPEYGGFGCCGKRGERRAGKWAADAQLRLKTAEEKEICSEYTRNVSCLTCSPLAGRIFHSDDPENETIPLCYDYCVETYIKCRFSLLRMFKLHPWRQGLVSKFPSSEEALESDAATFCERYASDPPYCYPEVKKLEDQFSSPPPADQTDCVCLTPAVTGRGIPVGVQFPRDKTKRMFVYGAQNIFIFDRKPNTYIEEPFMNMTLVTEGAGLPRIRNFIFHPRFRRNGRLFLFYLQSLNSTGHRGIGLFSVNVSEFQVSKDNPNQVDYGSHRLLLSAVYEKNLPGFNSHGGGLYFSDGLLHIAIGRAEGYEDIFNL